MNHKQFVTRWWQVIDSIGTATIAEIEAQLDQLEAEDRDYDQHVEWIIQTGIFAIDAFEKSRNSLREAIQTAYPTISAADQDAILGRMYARLNEFEGTSRSFKKWAIEKVKIDAQRVHAFHRLQSETRLFALDGIWRVLDGCGDLDLDNRLTPIECLTHVWRSVWDKLDSVLAESQPAKVSTRIWWFGYWAARAWKKDQLRLRGLDEKRKKAHDDADADNSPLPPPSAMWCPTCQGLIHVRAIEETYHLGCGHSRSLSIPANSKPAKCEPRAA